MFDLAIGLGLETLGQRSRAVFYCEREAYAASQLLALMEAQSLDAAPVWTDLATFDGRPFRGVVDCLIAGLPCQPYSVAGKRQGTSDQRSWGDGDGPIPHALRIIDEIRPALAFFENVPPWVMAGHFRGFGEELSALGYDIQRPVFLPASDVGASHRRERVFVLAIDPERGRGILRQSSGRGGFADGRGEGMGLQKAVDGSDPKGRSDASGNGQRVLGANECGGGGKGPDAENVERRNDVGNSGLQYGELQQRCVRPEHPGASGAVASARDGLIQEPWRQAQGENGVGSASAFAGDNTAGPRHDRAGSGADTDSGSGKCLSGTGCADVGNAQNDQRRGELAEGCERGGRRGFTGTDIALANNSSPRLKGGEQRGTCDIDRGGGAKHMDQLANFVEFSPQARAIQDGQKSLSDGLGSRRRLNPAFSALLMGAPWWWTHPEVTKSAQSEMASWRLKQRQHLLSLLGGLE